MYKSNINSGKNLVVKTFVLFSVIILIIGFTTAYFTQSGIGNTGNIIATNTKDTIGYVDNNNYMRNNLIPVNEEDVIKFAAISDKCKYKDDMYACSLYEFTITNNANVTSDMKVTLNPYPNEFANLYYMIYEENQEELSTSSKLVKKATHIDGNNSSVMIENVTLKPNENKTYTVIFYIKNLSDIDQTEVDAGKNFGAIIRVDSITTGTYISNTVGKTCYEMEEITEGEYVGTYKLTKFNGIDENGDPNNSCGVTKDDATGLYSVTVPSTIGSNKISTLGNTLFMAVDTSTFEFNEKSKISNIFIEDGIEIIEDGEIYNYGTFAGIGYYFDKTKSDPAPYESFNFNIKLPNTLKYIGTFSFVLNNIKEVSIPSSVETIGILAFGLDGVTTLSKVKFELDESGNSNLKTIGAGAFMKCKINQTDESGNDIPFIIPKSVETIGEDSFVDTGLKLISFEVSNENKSNLRTIGQGAFERCNLTYTDPFNPLIIPDGVTTIGKDAFGSSSSGTDDDPRNRYLEYIQFNGTLTAGNTDWYTSVENGGATTLNP